MKAFAVACSLLKPIASLARKSANFRPYIKPYTLPIVLNTILCLIASKSAKADSSSTGVYLGVGAGRSEQGRKLSQRENAGFFYKTPWLKHVMIGARLDWLNHKSVHVTSLNNEKTTLGLEGEAIYIDFSSPDDGFIQGALRFGLGELRMQTIESEITQQRLSPYAAIGANITTPILGANFGRLNAGIDIHWLKAFKRISDAHRETNVLSITPMLSIQVFEIDKR